MTDLLFSVQTIYNRNFKVALLLVAVMAGTWPCSRC